MPEDAHDQEQRARRLVPQAVRPSGRSDDEGYLSAVETAMEGPWHVADVPALPDADRPAGEPKPQAGAEPTADPDRPACWGPLPPC